MIKEKFFLVSIRSNQGGYTHLGLDELTGEELVNLPGNTIQGFGMTALDFIRRRC